MTLESESETPCPDNAHGTPLTAPAGASDDTPGNPLTAERGRLTICNALDFALGYIGAGSDPGGQADRDAVLRVLNSLRLAIDVGVVTGFEPREARDVNELAAGARVARGAEFEALLMLGVDAERVLVAHAAAFSEDAPEMTRTAHRVELVAAIARLNATFVQIFGGDCG